MRRLAFVSSKRLEASWWSAGNLGNEVFKSVTTRGSIPRRFTALVLGAVALTGCGDDKPASNGAPIAVVAGPLDTHCGALARNVEPVACSVGDVTARRLGPLHLDAGSGYGDTLANAEGDDDDCKYHITWSPSGGSRAVTFDVTPTTKLDGRAVLGAPLSIEAFLGDTHPAPNSGQKTTEVSPGHYAVGPVEFDAAGRWTVRFHVHEECGDGESSPHGHVAFFVDVP